MEVSAPGPGVTAECGRGGGEGCCRAAGEEGKEKSAKVDRTAQVVPLDDAEPNEVAPPYVMAVDDSSVDRALVTALLRRSKYRGTCLLLICGAFLISSMARELTAN
jgi:two-component response regulator (ARR-A family)